MALNRYQASQAQSNAYVFCENVIHNGPTLMKLCQPVLGVWFFKNRVYVRKPTREQGE